MEQELQNADVAFHEEKKIRTKEIATAHQTIGALRGELHDTSTRLEEQGAAVKGVVGVTGELRAAKQSLDEQREEMKDMGDLNEEMMGHVEELTTAFRQIDAEKTEGKCCKC